MIFKGSIILSTLICTLMTHHPSMFFVVHSKLSHKTWMYESMLNAAPLFWRGSKRRGAVDISLVSRCVEVLSWYWWYCWHAGSPCRYPTSWRHWPHDPGHGMVREQTHACISSLHGEINDNVKPYSVHRFFHLEVIRDMASYNLGTKLCHQSVISYFL